jgi:hypothetical protein
MALRMGHVYDALRLAQGVPEEAAKAAAEEVAGYENRMQGIEADLKLLKWMNATVIGLLLIVLGKLFIVP